MEPDTADRLAASMPWLDGAAETLIAATEPILGEDAPRGLKDALYGVWLGHPLHPAVVALPVGCWTASAIFDLLGEERAADLTLDLGLASAGLAAVSGAAQWRDATNDEGPRRLGALHAILNTAGTACYLGSSIARRNGNRTGGVALSTLGLAVTMASGWVGGELAYQMGVGVDRNAFQSPPDDWTDVLAEDDLPENTPVRVDVGDTPVMLYRDEHGIHAIGAVCSHLGGPLDEGKIENDCVECPWHGSVFRLRDGGVVHGPATSPQPRFETDVRDGRIYVRPQQPQAMEMPSAADLSAAIPEGIPEAVQGIAREGIPAARSAVENIPAVAREAVAGMPEAARDAVEGLPGAAQGIVREAADRVVSVLPGQGGEQRQDQSQERGSGQEQDRERSGGHGREGQSTGDALASGSAALGIRGTAQSASSGTSGERAETGGDYAGAMTGDAVTSERPAGANRLGGSESTGWAGSGAERGEGDSASADAAAPGDDLVVAGTDVPAPPTASAPNAESVPGDGSRECPPGYPIKGNADSGIYHKPHQGSYDRTIPEYCFASPEAAEAAGFRPVGGH